MNILVTGSRRFSNEQMMAEALRGFDRVNDFLIHGGAPGADKLAHLVWRKLGFVNDPDVVRPEYDYWVNKIGAPQGYKVAPTKRNGLMVEGRRTEEGPVIPFLVPDLVLAFYITPTPSGGTWDCHQKALAAGLDVIEYYDL